MELSPHEEPVWTYFDAQHRYILDQMKETYNTAIAVIKGTGCCAWSCYGYLLTYYPPAVHDRSAKETSPKDALTQSLASQLKTCLSALESKQADIVIGKLLAVKLLPRS